MTAGTISFSRGEDPLRADKLNAAFVERVLLKGDTMAGPLILSRDPVLPFEASTKQYIDALVTAHLTNFLSTTGGTLTGFLTLHADPVNPTHAVTKRYVDLALGAGGFISDAPNDGKAYGRASALWTPVLPISGGTLTGNLVVNSATVAIGLDAQASPALVLNGAAGNTRQVYFRTASKNRWIIVTDAIAESGSNLGSNFALYRYADDGTTLLATALNISRATGLTTINGRLLVNGSTDNGSSGLQVGGSIVTAGNVFGAGFIAGANGASFPALVVNGASGSDRQVIYQTNGVTRWVEAASGTAESGGSLGTDYTINRYNDAGTYLGTPLNISRATGAVAVAQSLSVGTTLGVTGEIRTTSGRIVSQGTANTSVCVYDPSQASAVGMFLGGGKTLYFGNMDGTGNYVGPYHGLFDTVAGNFAARGSLFANGGIVNVGSDTDFSLFRAGTSGVDRYVRWSGTWAIAFTGTNGNVLFLNYQSTNLMTVGGNGDLVLNVGNAYKPGGGVWAATSDERLKRDIAPYDAGLPEVLRLDPIRYKFNGQGGTRDDDVERIGLSAQAAQKVMPELVQEMPRPIDAKTGELGEPYPDQLPGQLALDASPLTWAFVNAFKEIDARLRALENRG